MGQKGSPEVVYPRVNNFSILILSLSYLFVILSLISEFGGGTGWTLYPPLSTSFMSLSPSDSNILVSFVLLMKSHLQSYPCPLQINFFWNLGFLLGITIILQIITGIFLGLHYTSDLNSAYSSVFFFIREIYYGWSLRC